MIYLEPRKDFEEAILFEKNDKVYYDFDTLISCLEKEYIHQQEEDPTELALTWLSYNIIPSLPYLGPNAPNIIREFNPFESYDEETNFILLNDKMWEIMH